MNLRISISIILLLTLTLSFGQNKSIQILGNNLAESISKNDTLLFKKLILPKESVINKFKDEYSSKMSNEELKNTIKQIEESYSETVKTLFLTKFMILTTKIDIFKVNFENIKYNVVGTDNTVPSLDLTLIHSNLNHETLKHFTFMVSKFNDHWYLASPTINISENNKFEEAKALKKVTLSEDENGNLISEGIIILEKENANQNNILSCILNSPVIIGVEESSNDPDKGFYLNGKWEYTSYVDGTSTIVGIVEFKYEYKISNGSIHYKYFDYIHRKEDSNFQSIGQLPKKFNKKISDVFDENQYNEMLFDIHLNLRNAVKNCKSYVDKCIN